MESPKCDRCGFPLENPEEYHECVPNQVAGGYRKYASVFPTTLCQHKDGSYQCILMANHEGGHEMRKGCQ